MAVGRWEESG